MASASQDNISVLSLDDLRFLIKSIIYKRALQFLNKNNNQGNEMREASLTLTGFRIEQMVTYTEFFVLKIVFHSTKTESMVIRPSMFSQAVNVIFSSLTLKEKKKPWWFTS